MESEDDLWECLTLFGDLPLYGLPRNGVAADETGPAALLTAFLPRSRQERD